MVTPAGLLARSTSLSRALDGAKHLGGVACTIACLLLAFPGVEIARADAPPEAAAECRIPDRAARRAEMHAKAKRVRTQMQLAAGADGQAFVPLSTTGMNYRSATGSELRAISRELSSAPPASPR